MADFCMRCYDFLHWYSWRILGLYLFAFTRQRPPAKRRALSREEADHGDFIGAPPHDDHEPTNQRIVRAFRSHFKMLVDVLDPEEAALSLSGEADQQNNTRRGSSSGSKFKRSYKIVDAMRPIWASAPRLPRHTGSSPFSSTTAYQDLIVLLLGYVDKRWVLAVSV